MTDQEKITVRKTVVYNQIQDGDRIIAGRDPYAIVVEREVDRPFIPTRDGRYEDVNGNMLRLEDGEWSVHGVDLSDEEVMQRAPFEAQIGYDEILDALRTNGYVDSVFGSYFAGIKPVEQKSVVF